MLEKKYVLYDNGFIKLIGKQIIDYTNENKDGKLELMSLNDKLVNNLIGAIYIIPRDFELYINEKKIDNHIEFIDCMKVNDYSASLGPDGSLGQCVYNGNTLSKTSSKGDYYSKAIYTGFLSSELITQGPTLSYSLGRRGLVTKYYDTITATCTWQFFFADSEDDFNWPEEIINTENCTYTYQISDINHWRIFITPN